MKASVAGRQRSWRMAMVGKDHAFDDLAEDATREGSKQLIADKCCIHIKNIRA